MTTPLLWRRRAAWAALLAAPISSSFAQGMPGGGMGGPMGGPMGGAMGGRRPNGERPNERDRADEAGDRAPAIHPYALMAERLLSQEGLVNNPATLQKLRDFAREARDFAGLEERRGRTRISRSVSATTALPDLGRDLRALSDDMSGLAAAASDLQMRWTALDQAMTEPERGQVLRVVAVAIGEANGPGGRRPGGRQPRVPSSTG